MKKIIIKGKRNIDGLSNKKNKKRKITEKITNKKVFDKLTQIEYLNKLFLEEKYDGMDFLKTRSGEKN